MRSLRLTLCLAAALALSVPAAGQAAPSSSDIFSQWHASANDAADRALAAALSDRPWMKLNVAPAPDEPATAVLDPVGRLRAGVERVRQLRPVIEPILRQEGIPAELGAIALVESGGQPFALSPKGARGVWQFMPDTARRYGLVVSSNRDDRTDIAKSTRAAARYLRDLYQQFGDWRLAFAAYNGGEQRISRAVARARSATFESIERTLPLETRAYVPAVVSAIATLGNSSRFVTAAPALGISRRAGVVFASSDVSE